MKDTKDIKDVNNMKLRYRVSKRNFFSRLTWILLGLSAVFTLMANWGFWNVEDEYFIYLQVILPVVSCILYMLIINHMGEKLFFLTFIPVILGAAFLIVNEANSKQPLHSILIITLCIVVAVSYIMTVFGAIRTKWLLLPISACRLLIALLWRTTIYSSAREAPFLSANGSPSLQFCA